MKLTFFSTQKKSPATLFYLAGLKNLKGVEVYSTAWQDFDIALIMGFNEDLAFVREAKTVNPKIKIGLIDPRGHYIEAIHELVDFFVVDSLEMIDFFSHYSKPIFQYYEYYPVTPRLKKHVKKENVVIGYHGNKVHLMSLWPGVSEALSRLGKERNVTFKAIYNKQKLGEWEIGCPDHIKVEHVQLSDETYTDEIHSCDIGIAPAFCPVPDSVYKPSFAQRKIYLLDEDDYVLRFKVPSNAGRIIVFALLGVPVVADMLPSSCQFIQHGENGFLAYSSGGWYQSLLRLIDSHELRNTMSEKLFNHAREVVDYDKQNKSFEVFLKQQLITSTDSQVGPMIKYQRRVLPNLNVKYARKKLIGGRGSLL